MLTCFFTSFCKYFADAFLGILVNITHSYAVIRRAATDTQKEWLAAAAAKGTACDRSVAKNKFSDKWIRNFLTRFNLSRQRITAAIKGNRPPEKEVQDIMAAIQVFIVKEGFEPCDIL